MRPKVRHPIDAQMDQGRRKPSFLDANGANIIRPILLYIRVVRRERELNTRSIPTDRRFDTPAPSNRSKVESQRKHPCTKDNRVAVCDREEGNASSYLVLQALETFDILILLLFHSVLVAQFQLHVGYLSLLDLCCDLEHCKYGKNNARLLPNWRWGYTSNQAPLTQETSTFQCDRRKVRPLPTFDTCFLPLVKPEATRYFSVYFFMFVFACRTPRRRFGFLPYLVAQVQNVWQNNMIIQDQL